MGTLKWFPEIYVKDFVQRANFYTRCSDSRGISGLNEFFCRCGESGVGGIGGSIAGGSAGKSIADSGIEAPAIPAAPDAKAPAPEAPAEKAVEKPVEKPVEATWVEVVSLNGTADQASQVFALSGKETRMVYEFVGSEEDFAIATIYLEKEGTDIMVDGGIPVVMITKPESNTTALHKKAGNYFLDIKAANLESWTVKIEEKK